MRRLALILCAATACSTAKPVEPLDASTGADGAVDASNDVVSPDAAGDASDASDASLSDASPQDASPTDAAAEAGCVPTYGPNDPQFALENLSIGTQGWLAPSNVTSEDFITANVALTSGQASRYLVARDFGFAIPSNATIKGIEVTIKRYSQTGSGTLDNQVHLVKNALIGFTDKAQSTPWPSFNSVATYGAAFDLWNDGWTPTFINSPQFGVAISVKRTASGADTARVDSIKVKIYVTCN